MAERAASVYLTVKGTLIVLSAVKTTTGLSRDAPPITVLQTQDPAVLGQAVLEAMAVSGKIVPHPTDWAADERESKVVFAPLFKAVGVTSWRGVQRNCAVICISETGGELELCTWYRDGSGYSASEEDYRRIPDNSPLTVGTEIIRAFVETG